MKRKELIIDMIKSAGSSTFNDFSEYSSAALPMIHLSVLRHDHLLPSEMSGDREERSFISEGKYDNESKSNQENRNKTYIAKHETNASFDNKSCENEDDNKLKCTRQGHHDAPKKNVSTTDTLHSHKDGGYRVSHEMHHMSFASSLLLDLEDDQEDDDSDW